jgi:hypothetical protein
LFFSSSSPYPPFTSSSFPDPCPFLIPFPYPLSSFFCFSPYPPSLLILCLSLILSVSPLLFSLSSFSPYPSSLLILYRYPPSASLLVDTMYRSLQTIVFTFIVMSLIHSSSPSSPISLLCLSSSSLYCNLFLFLFFLPSFFSSFFILHLSLSCFSPYPLPFSPYLSSILIFLLTLTVSFLILRLSLSFSLLNLFPFLLFLLLSLSSLIFSLFCCSPYPPSLLIPSPILLILSPSVLILLHLILLHLILPLLILLLSLTPHLHILLILLFLYSFFSSSSSPCPFSSCSCSHASPFCIPDHPDPHPYNYPLLISVFWGVTVLIRRCSISSAQVL